MRNEIEDSSPVGTQRTYGSVTITRPGCHPDAKMGQNVAEVDEHRPEHKSASNLWSGLIVLGIMMVVAGVTASHSGWVSGSSNERSSNLRELPDATSETSAAHSLGSLSLETINEYGGNDEYGLALYGYDMLIEPFRDTTIRVTHSTAPKSRHTAAKYHWLLVAVDGDGAPRERSSTVIDDDGGSSVRVELKQPGKRYSLVVQQMQADGRVVAEGRATVVCKYVRRELRQLTDADRDDFFAAMRVFFTLSSEEGFRRYGKEFTNYVHLAATHNSQNYCYHGGMHFPLAHAAFNVIVERSLQLVNPRVSLASWDFMVESGTLGAEWPESEVFSHGWFGSAFGNQENNYQINDGHFANISSVYDPEGAVLGDVISPEHNPYGFISQSHDYTDLNGVVRTHSFCGMRGEVVFPQCATFVSCFEDSSSLYEWTSCMESQVHATMHGMLGGGFNCNTDMEEILRKNPLYSRGLLTFVMEYVVATLWPNNHVMEDYNTCDTSCVHGQEEPCGCTCDTDPFAWSDDEVRDFMTSSFETLHRRSGGDIWVDQNDDLKWPYGFMQDGERLSEDQTVFLLRTMMVIACEPGSLGAMSTGVSPLDPIFWVLHPMFEKALHIIQLSSKYADTFSFDWVPSSCSGSGFTDQLPFSEKLLGLGDSTDFLTNEDLINLFNPSNDRLTYVYDSFQSWGTCDWDPCPECSDASLGERKVTTGRALPTRKPGLHLSRSRRLSTPHL